MTKYKGKPLPSMTGGELDRRCDMVSRDLAALSGVAAVNLAATALLGPSGLPLGMVLGHMIGQRRAQHGGPTHIRWPE